MKKIILALLAFSVSFNSFSQKASKSEQGKKEVIEVQKKFNCDSMVVDFESGLINGKIGPSSPLDSVKKYLPCISTEFPVGTEERICGSGALMEKQGIYFNTEHGFIEFYPGTKAHLSLDVMGLTEEELATVAGDPTQITDLQPYTDRAVQSAYLFPKSYGCLAIWVDQLDKKVFKVQLHNQGPSLIFLCVE